MGALNMPTAPGYTIFSSLARGMRHRNMILIILKNVTFTLTHPRSSTTSARCPAGRRGAHTRHGAESG